MVNEVVDAVTAKMGETFGTDYHYYFEDVQQGMVKPCFTVNLIEASQRMTKHVLHERTVPLVVHYFPADLEKYKRECLDVAEPLHACLETVALSDGLIRGHNFSWYVLESGVLELFVTYRFTLIEDIDLEKMRTLSIIQG